MPQRVRRTVPEWVYEDLPVGEEVESWSPVRRNHFCDYAMPKVVGTFRMVASRIAGRMRFEGAKPRVCQETITRVVTSKDGLRHDL